MTSAMPEFSAYFPACCDCGFDAFAVPVGRQMISAISLTPSGRTDFLFRYDSDPGFLDR
jgi:hypothetical protein